LLEEVLEVQERILILIMVLLAAELEDIKLEVDLQ
jgi:hypothetical protein